MTSSDESKLHQQALRVTLRDLNEYSDNPFILKGGNSLVQCYGLRRMSGDIDLDASHLRSNRKNFFSRIQDICNRHGWTYRIAKDTDTVGRVLIHYSETEAPLKVEVSYRNMRIAPNDVTRRNGMTVYKLNKLAQMKCAAYSNRDKIRDLVDLCFICDNYFDDLSEETKGLIRETFQYKGLDQLDYLLNSEKDLPFSQDDIIDSFLEANDRLGLISEENEQMMDDEIKFDDNYER